MLYLIHFARPFKHAKHYLGFVKDKKGLDARIARHKSGAGSKLLKNVNLAGIDWEVVRIMDGDRNEERRLKNGHSSTRYCPRCNPKVKI